MFMWPESDAAVHQIVTPARERGSNTPQAEWVR
jgi:hypothetical protein